MSRPPSVRIEQLCAQIIQGSWSARYELVGEFDPFIRKRAIFLARKNRIPHLYYDDVIGTCRMAAYHHVAKFEPTLSCNFANFVWFALSQAVEEFAGKMIYGIYFPQKLLQAMGRIRAAEQRLQAEGVKNPDVLQLAAASNTKPTDVDVYRSSKTSLLPMIELDAPISVTEATDGATRLDRLLEDSSFFSGTTECSFETRQILSQALLTLSPREEYIMRLLTFGLRGEEYDHRQVAALMDMTHQNVSLIKQSALKKLQKYMQRNRLRLKDLVAGY